MSTSNPQSVVINVTVATLLNLTTTTETDYATTLNNSNWNVTSFNNSSWDPDYDNSSWDPYCPSCYPQFVTESPPLASFTYTYLYYGFLSLLLFITIVSIKLGISRRNQAQRRLAAAQRRTARRQAESSYGSTNNSNNSNDDNSCHMGTKEFDFPPAYDEVMQSYLMAKQQQPSSHENDTNEGAVGFTAVINSSSENNLSTTAISTLTIDTDILSSNHVSALDLNNPSMSSIMTAATTVTTAAVVNLPPPSYESSIEMSQTNRNNDHIV